MDKLPHMPKKQTHTYHCLKIFFPYNFVWGKAVMPDPNKKTGLSFQKNLSAKSLHFFYYV